MRLFSVLVVAAVMATLPVWAQEKNSPPSGPASKLEPVKPEDIKGEVTNPTLSIRPGQSIAAGDFLSVEFEYTTETPGKTAVSVEAFIDGKEFRDGFGHQPCTLTEKSGKAKVKIGLHWPPDVIVDELKLFVWPASGAPGKRYVATVKAPVRFVGYWSTNKEGPIVQSAQMAGKAGDQVMLLGRTLMPVLMKDKNGKVHESRVEKIYPTAKLFAKDVQAYDLDGTPLEQAKLAKRLAIPTPVVVFAVWGKVEPPDPYYLKLFKEGTIALVVPRDTLYPRPAPKIDQKGP